MLEKARGDDYLTNSEVLTKFLEQRDNKGNTALLRCGQHGNAGVCELLVEFGAYLSSKNDEGQSALDRAREGKEAGHAKVIEILEKALAKPGDVGGA